MTYNQVIAKFGTQVKLAAALGITQGTVSPWRKAGIPPRWQYHLEVITDGALRADKRLRRPANAQKSLSVGG
jgi:hypothetical protein